MVIACNIITPHVRQLAVNLGISETRAVNLVTYWLSEQQGDNKGRYPTVEELKEFMDKNQESLNDVYLALPQYQMNDELEAPIKTREDGIIEMRPLPSTNSILHFYDLFEGSNELENIKANVTSYLEAYRFMLYREMAFIQNKLSKNVQNAAKADSLAIRKLIEYKKLNPQDNVRISLEGATAIQYTPVGQKEKTVYIKGNHIYNSKGEEIYKGDSVDRNKIYAKYSLRRGESVVVEHKGSKYIVNLKSQILSVKTGKIMLWGEENGDRKSIITLAESKFSALKGYDVFLSTLNNIKMNNSPSSINIYAGTGENAHLSNFAERKFRFYTSNQNFEFAKHLSDWDPYPYSAVEWDAEFHSVEQAFQFSKTVLALQHLMQKYEDVVDDRGTEERTREFEEKVKEINSIQEKIINTTSGGALRSLGRSVPLSKDAIALWDKYKAETLKGLIKESFLQNEEAAKQLLATRDIPLTHKQDRGEYKTLFPKLLMEVREELREVFPQHDPLAVDEAYGNRDLFSDDTTETSDLSLSLSAFEALTQQKPQQTTSNVEIHKGNWSRADVATQSDKVFLFGDNTNDRVNTHYVPSMTQAVIRGLPNAIGIDTKKNRGTAESSYFTDEDFDTFKAQVDEAIQQAVNSGKTIVIPEGGIGTGKAQLQQRAPKLFNYLQEQLNKLQQGEITQKNTNEEYSLVENANKELLEVLGNDNNAQSEIKDVVKTVKKGISFDEALKGVDTIFTKEEIEQIKQGLNGKRLQVLSVSRLTDPAFFSKEIIKFLEENSKKSLSDPTRTNVIEIWSKHDGVPIQDILKACKKYKVAPMVSFSITGLGDTALEKGVLKYQDLIPLIGQLIESGDLNPQTTTIRIDPILVGETNMDDIKKIVQSCKDLGIKKFVTSLVQSYGYLDGTAKDRKVTSGINNALASEGRSYDWDKYYGKDSRGRINFKPKQLYIDEIGKELLELNKDPEIEIETCSFLIKGLKASACLDPLIIERITGISVTRSDGTYDRDTSRPDCMCYGAHSDMFRVNEKKCFSSCAYCYAGHSNDSNFKYYNEDGTLVDRPLTRVNKLTSEQSLKVNTPLSKSTEKKILEYGGYFEGGGATLSTVPSDIWNDVAGYFMGNSPLSEERALEFLQYVSMDPNQYALYSGDAIGSDNYWGLVALEYGIENVTNYRPEDITDENREDATKEVMKANKFLGRVFPMLPREATEHSKERTQELADYLNRLILRDALQASSADAIFAIGKIKGKPTSDGIIYKSQVEGGTGWAVQIGINQGKPVYVFDQVRNKWYKNEGTAENRKFIPMQEAPKLTTRFAGIGTRNINDKGRLAIKDVFINTFGYAKEVLESNTKSIFKDITGELETDGDFVNPQDITIENSMDIMGALGIVSPTTNSLEIGELAGNAMDLPRPTIKNETVLQQIEDESYQAYQTFSPQKLSDRCNMLYLIFDDVMTDLMEETLENLEEDLDNAGIEESINIINKMNALLDEESGRHSLLQMVPFGEICIRVKEQILEAKEQVLKESEDANSEYAALEYDKVLDNFDFLMARTCRVIEDRENIRIIPKKVKNAEGLITLQGIIAKSTEDSEQEENDFLDNDEGNGEEHSGVPVNIKLQHPSKSISKITNSILLNIPEYGDNSTDDLGWTRYMKKGHTHAILLNELSKMVNAEHWYNPNGNTLRKKFPALAKMESRYPWVVGIMNRLYNDESAISAFFSDMYMPFNKQGKLSSSGLMILNDTIVADSVINQVLSMFESKLQINDYKTIWDKQGNYRTDVLLEMQNTLSKLNLTKEIQDKEERAEKASIITDLFKSIGIVLQKESINRKLKSAEEVLNIIGALSEASILVKGLIADNKDVHLISEYKTVYSKIAELIGELSPLQHKMTFREGGKDYPNYSVPSELEIMMKELTNPNKEERAKYIELNFKDSGFLYDPEKGEYRIKIILDLLDSDKIRLNLEIVTVRHAETWSGSTDYKDWDKETILDILRGAYFTPDNVKDHIHFSYYPIPIPSDTEAMFLLKLPSYRTTKKSTFKEKLLPLFREVVEQELYRINKVQQRRKNPSISKIVNYDKNGDQFFFFPYLNDYTTTVVSDTGEVQNMKFLDAVVYMNNSFKYNTLDITQLINKAIVDTMDSYYNDYIGNVSDNDVESMATLALQSRYAGNEEVLKAALDKLHNSTLDNLGDPVEAHELMQEFFWNYCYALTQILQLTITDPAFYKDDNGVDIQKRFKLVIASGHRLNTQSKYGRKTSYNMVVSDKMIASYSYNGYKKALLIAVDRKWISKEYMDSVLEGYLDINTADGQGIRSISSFKSVLHMLGKMTDSLEKALDNFEKGTPTKKDFLQVLQVIKPFLFGSTIEEDGLGGSMRIGRLIKNSEMPLLSGLAVVAKGILGKSSFFNAIHEFMEEHSIDTLQFESCIKTGGLGIIDIHFSQNKLNKYIDEHKGAWEQIQEAADESAKTDREKWESGNKELLKSGKITQEEFNKRLSYTEPSKKEIQEVLTKHIINENFDPTIDREDPQYINRFKKGSIISLPYSKMMIAQPTPLHLFDTVSKIGSQIQNIAPADLPDDIEFNIKGIKLDKQQFLDLYDSIFVANKVDAFLKVQDKFNDVSALSNMLLEKVLDNPKYGRQYLDALMLVDDPNNPGLKIFNVGFDFPSMRQQIAELMLSTFKRAVTVQEITGGNAILTSSFIFTDQLKTEFKEDGGIKCAPCYLPAHSRKFYEPFMDKDGIIDIDKIPLELREMISYRIPTEGKYSTLPIRVVGFLPSICGSAIMLPVDISYIAGEDYDVDKRFLMIPAFRMVNKYNFKKAELDFFEAHPEYKTKLKEERKRQFSEFLLEYQKAKELDPNLEDKINDKNTYLKWLNSKNIKTTEWLPEVSNAWKNWWKAVDKSKYIVGKKAVKINMDISKLKDNPSIDNIIEIMSKSKKEERDNLLIELLLAILTHPLVAHQIANPGHFNSIKRGAKTGTLLGDPSMRKEYMQDKDITDPVQMYESLKSLSVKQLALEVAKYSPSRPVIVPSTFVYNHLQNMTAGKLVGNYANNTTSQTKLQSTDIGVAPLNRIIFNGRLIDSVSEMYTGTLPDGTSLLISKNCSETSASSVDDVKDPNLKQLGQNPNTAKILGGMLRAGLTVEEASLFFHLPAVKSLIALKGKINRWDLEEYIAYLYDDMLGTENSEFKAVKAWAYKNYGTTSITTLNLVRTIAGAESKEESLKTYLAFYNMVVASEYLSQLTMNSRQDSPNGAISHTLGGSIKQVMNLNRIHIESLQLGYPLTNVTSDFIQPNLLSKVPSIATGNKIDIIKLIMGTKMRRLQAAYTLGIEKSKELVDLYFAVQNKILLDRLMEFSKYAEVSETTISLILEEFINYMCSKTELLGDTEEDSMNYKIEYYKNLFPKKASSLIDSILELKDNPTIQSFNFNKTVSLKDSARLSEEQKQQHMDNLDRLMLSDDPRVVQFAEDLYLHTFYTDGLNFGPNSIGKLFSVPYINKFKEVRDLFRYMPNSVTSKDVLDFMEKLMASSYVLSLLPTTKSAKATSIEEDGSYVFNVTEVPNVTIDGVLLVALFTLIEVLNPLGFPIRIPAYLSSIQENVKLVTYTPYEYSYNLKFNANTSLELALLEAKAEDPIDNIEEEIKRKIEENKEFLERQQFLNTDPDLSGDPYSIEDGLLELINSGGKKLC